MAILRYLNPWKFRREQEARRLVALRTRDGDNCARCRRPLRFDLTSSHDLGAVIEETMPGASEAFDTMRLCHRRCSAAGVDHTDEVSERVRRKAEAALFARPNRKRKAA